LSVHFLNKNLSENSMIKIRLFFFTLVVTSVAWAQTQPSSLQVRMWDNSLFATVFGGDENEKYQRAYNARSINGGDYYLKITQKNASKTVVVFEGQIEIPAASRVQVIVQADGSLELSTIEDSQRTASSFDLKTKISNLENKVRGTTNTRESERNQLIEPLEFTDLKNRMTNARTEYAKDSIAMRELKQYLYTTAYVVQLAKLYKSEEDRLDYAKSAYTRVVDPEEFFRVHALFVKEANKQALDAYMKENEKYTQKRESQGLF